MPCLWLPLSCLFTSFVAHLIYNAFMYDWTATTHENDVITICPCVIWKPSWTKGDDNTSVINVAKAVCIVHSLCSWYWLWQQKNHNVFDGNSTYIHSWILCIHHCMRNCRCRLNKCSIWYWTVKKLQIHSFKCLFQISQVMHFTCQSVVRTRVRNMQFLFLIAKSDFFLCKNEIMFESHTDSFYCLRFS